MPSLRITGGAFRGRRIALPPHDVRPTSERARQAFFNIVAPRIAEARFLDLFAGSGVFAFEAVSRGAAEALAVDSSPRAIAEIRRLAASWEAGVHALQADALSFLQNSPAFDLAYADPPYDFARYGELLAALDSITDSAGFLVAIEHRRNTDPFSSVELRSLERVPRREYGEIWISMFERRDT
jgi:16S rRNA (guanine966-N2)-methyltransferase